MACHRRIEDRLATLERAGAQYNEKPAEALAAVDACLAFFERNGVLHTEDEERSVFPRLRPHLSPEDLSLVERLESQHAEADRLHRALRESVEEIRGSGASRDRLQAYQEIVSALAALYRSHIAEEDRHLIAVAKDKLSSQDLHEISSEMRKRRG